MVAVVSENTKDGKEKKMTDKELASAVLQYHPEPFSQKTLIVLCSTIRYLSHIQVLDICLSSTPTSRRLPDVVS